MPLIGDLDQMLRALEQQILNGPVGWPEQGIKTCAFYFGADEQTAQSRTPPFVQWIVHAGEVAQGVRDIADDTRFATVDDLVKITARCAGQGVAQGRDLRRSQYEASRQVFLAVSLAVNQQHQGYMEDHGWASVHPETVGDAFYPIDYTFAVRAPRLTPQWPTVQPTEQDPTISLQEPVS